MYWYCVRFTARCPDSFGKDAKKLRRKELDGNPKFKIQKPKTQNPKPKTQNSKLKTQNSKPKPKPKPKLKPKPKTQTLSSKYCPK